jgi:serine/threonine-protein kinase
VSRLPGPGETWNDRYEITAELGRGGFGRVYRAWDPLLERDVAIKMLHLSEDFSPTDHQRFRREVNIAASLDHHNMVTVFDGGEHDGLLYLVMLFVPGRDLRYELAEGPLTPQRAASIIGQVGAALDYAHDKGLVHRDVKPGNILCQAHSEAVFLADFGISRRVDQTTDDSVTKGLAPATVAYAAPEQMRTSARVDGRADQYALGCVLFECLTGRKPFDGEIAAMITAHLHDHPPPVTDLRPELPAAWNRVISTAMAKDPADRFARCAELARAAEFALPPPPRDAQHVTALVPSFTTPTAPVAGQHAPTRQSVTRRSARRPGARPPSDSQSPPATAPAPAAPRRPGRPSGVPAPAAANITAEQPVAAVDAILQPRPDAGGIAPRRLRPVGVAALALAAAAVLTWLAWPAIGALWEADDAVTATADKGDAGPGAAALDDAQRALLSAVNVFDPVDCRPSTATELEGQQVAVACESGDQAPTRVVFRQFASTTERDAALAALAASADTGADCRTADRATHVYRGADGPGRVVCVVADDVAGLSWTLPDQPIMGSARIDDAARARDLYSWWDTLVQRSAG